MRLSFTDSLFLYIRISFQLIMKIEDLYKIFLSHPIICTDTRKIVPDSLFFALKGSNFNGNLFAKEAVKIGAKYAIADDPDLSGSVNIIVVENVLSTLQMLATYHRNQLNIPILAITGSNGKTTTKELTNIILTQKYNVGATHGNLNNHIGVPLTLLSFNNSINFGIVEMGANHIGEIAYLCNIALPDYGLITNIGKAHIEGFGSLEGIITAKTELYNHLSKNNGKVFCNATNNLLITQCKKNNCDVIFYGHPNGIIDGKIINNNPYLKLEIWDEKNSIKVNTHLVGSYNAENLLAAFCIGKYFGIDINQSKNMVEAYKPDNMRSQWLKTKRNNIIVDAYNANPTSMQLAINNFMSLNVDNKVLVLGDMLELGETEEQEHYSIIKLIESLKIDKVILIGRIFKRLNKNNSILCFEDINQLTNSDNIKKIKNSNILMKGSRRVQLEKALEYL